MATGEQPSAPPPSPRPAKHNHAGHSLPSQQPSGPGMVHDSEPAAASASCHVNREAQASPEHPALEEAYAGTSTTSPGAGETPVKLANLYDAPVPGTPPTISHFAVSSRLPSMRFDELFEKDLNRLIYASDGATQSTPPCFRRATATVGSPKSPRSRTHSHYSPKKKARAMASSPTEDMPSMSFLMSSTNQSPKRRKTRHTSPRMPEIEVGSTLPFLTTQQPTPSHSSTSTGLFSSAIKEEKPSPAEVPQPQVKVQPPTPVIDDGGFTTLPDQEDLWKELDDSRDITSMSTRDEQQGIRSIADITNDSSSSHRSQPSTPPLSPSSTANSTSSSQSTRIMTPASLSEAFDMGAIGLHCSPSTRKPVPPTVLIENSADDEEEDGDVQIEKLMNSLHRPYSFSASPKSPRSRRNSHRKTAIHNGATFNHELGDRDLSSLQRRFEPKAGTPPTDFDDPFSFVSRSGTSSKVCAGKTRAPSPVQHHQFDHGRPQAGDFDFAALSLDSDSPPIAWKRARDESSDEEFYERGFFKEESLWDLQEAVVCKGDRVEFGSAF